MYRCVLPLVLDHDGLAMVWCHCKYYVPQTVLPCVQQAPFDQAEFAAAMKKSGVYRCAANLWWLDTYWTPQAGIPYNVTAIKSMSTFMDDPLKAVDRLGIVIRVEHVAATPSETQNLQRISPEELHFAFLLKCNAVIAGGASEDGFHSACPPLCRGYM